MLSGYQRTTLQGLGCGIEPCAKCGMGDLLDPSTWGPSDWLVAIGVGWALWKTFSPNQTYKRVLTRRLKEIQR